MSRSQISSLETFFFFLVRLIYLFKTQHERERAKEISHPHSPNGCRSQSGLDHNREQGTPARSPAVAGVQSLGPSSAGLPCALAKKLDWTWSNQDSSHHCDMGC